MAQFQDFQGKGFLKRQKHTFVSYHYNFFFFGGGFIDNFLQYNIEQGMTMLVEFRT
jgi:hypothetical protein